MNNWKELGFKFQPKCVFANGNEVLYRISGGKSNSIGSFFSPLKINSVSEAEKNLNIIQYGNLCLRRGAFKVKAGTKLWVGEVAGDEIDFVQNKSEQIYIENPLLSVQQIGSDEILKQDFSAGYGSTANN
jgi:hypothetical protein